MDDLLTRTDLEQLASDGPGRHVSMYLPTHRAGRETEGDRLRLKSLLNALEHTLVEQGVGNDEVHHLLAPAWELHGDGMFWRYNAEGLALFLREGEAVRTARLPFPVPELVTVGERYVISPALPALGDEHFLTLTLSHKRTRLLRGNQAGLEQLEAPNMPGRFEDVFDQDHPRSDAIGRPVSAGRAGPSVYYGTGGPDGTEKKQEMAEFFREVDNGAFEVLRARHEPLVLAGLPEWVAAYREVSRYPHIARLALERNPDELDEQGLHELLWPLVRERVARDDEQQVERLRERLGTGRGSTDLPEVLRAAREGRVDTLLVAREACWSGHGEGNSEPVVLLDGSDPCEQVEEAVSGTLVTSGQVRVIDQLPDEALVAAVLRY
ncbi:baeRF3 domain-containing protein [Ornithinicoccus halotolerans]|uniref:baeRF3 domain-containing protein n=1 Tax=Ornithinicoccus halotolerans TaxID=1748220 RepID=UPI001294BA51|nr:hypothetical protein [Ornithinicoccus halotolerans]